jgi:hypothetical protein
MVTKVTLIQAILPVVPQVPILVEVVVVLAKVNIKDIQELVVPVDQAQWLYVTQIHTMLPFQQQAHQP